MLLFPHLPSAVLVIITLCSSLAYASSTILLPRTNVTTIANSTFLRILPLGNSITFGYLSTTGNGYRQPLLTLLTNAGSPVQYVGSVRAGSMTDNFNEGHSGAIISEIAAYANLSLPELPNVVLLMAGTNDCVKDVEPATAPERLGDLLDQIIAVVPEALVLVAQLTPTTNATAQAFMLVFNAAIPAIVSARTDAGAKILLVNMMDYLTVEDLKDGLHPTDEGYGLMANAWFDGMKEAGTKGLIGEPEETNVTAAIATTTTLASSAATAVSKSNAKEGRVEVLPLLVMIGSGLVMCLR